MDIELGELVVKQLESDPASHEQLMWLVDISNPQSTWQKEKAQQTSCGTVGCIAGWTVHLAGHVPNFRGHVTTIAGYEALTIPNAARVLLDIPNHIANEIFYDTENKSALSKLKSLLTRNR